MCECVSVLAIRCDDADDGKLHYRSFGKQLRSTVGVGRWEYPDGTDRYLQYVQWESSRMKLLEEWSICCFLSSQARSTPGKSRFLFFFYWRPRPRDAATREYIHQDHNAITSYFAAGRKDFFTVLEATYFSTNLCMVLRDN